MTDIDPLRRELVARVLGGNGMASPDLRRAAFDDADLDEPLRTLVDKVAHGAQLVTDEDIAAVRAAGLSENQIFEVVVCAAVGQADRQYTAALAALAAAARGPGGSK
jgi:alkylhydroperoxidase family enzyme